MKEYGYARVSSRDQNEGRQIAALKEMGIEEGNIFVDKKSGRDFERTMYKRMINKVREDDVIYIKSIDRLGRNYREILEQWEIITKKKKADIVVLDMPILDTRRDKDLIGTFLSDIVLALLSYVAETERTSIRQRQSEGIAVAKEKGVKFGREPKPLPGNFHKAYQMWKTGKANVTEASEFCGMARTTFYEKAKRYESDKSMVTDM